MIDEIRGKLVEITGCSEQGLIDGLKEVVHDLCAGDARLTVEEAIDIVRRVYPRPQTVSAETAKMTIEKMLTTKMRMQDLESEIIDTGEPYLIMAFYRAISDFCDQVRIQLDSRRNGK